MTELGSVRYIWLVQSPQDLTSIRLILIELQRLLIGLDIAYERMPLGLDWKFGSQIIRVLK